MSLSYDDCNDSSYELLKFSPFILSRRGSFDLLWSEEFYSLIVDDVSDDEIYDDYSCFCRSDRVGLIKIIRGYCHNRNLNISENERIILSTSGVKVTIKQYVK